MTLSHRVFHPVCRGQWAGRCSIGLRAGAAKRAGTLTRSRRRVAPRATAWLPPASVPAARSRLCAITAQPSQAQLAANSPDGIWASGPSIKSAKVVSMMAWRRWVMSASAVGRVGVGHKRVIAPHGKQRVRVAGVFDAAHHQPHGERADAAQPQGVGGFGDLGIRDQRAGVGVFDRSRIVHRGVGGLVDTPDRGADALVSAHRQGELDTFLNAGGRSPFWCRTPSRRAA